ncbi:hypothetical protein D3C87_1961360 [compost metagenome]
MQQTELVFAVFKALSRQSGKFFGSERGIFAKQILPVFAVPTFRGTGMHLGYRGFKHFVGFKTVYFLILVSPVENQERRKAADAPLGCQLQIRVE